MERVSSGVSFYDSRYFMNKNSVNLNKTHNKITANRSLIDPRDNPAAAANSVKIASKMNRLQTFAENAASVQHDVRLAETSLTEANNILQEVRQLTIQAAHGTYTADDRKIIATQLDEYLKGLLDLANVRNEKGVAIFSGTRHVADAFRTLESNVEGSGFPVITKVEYTGNQDDKKLEIADGRYINFNTSGDKMFWAYNDKIFSNVDAGNYRVTQDSSVLIDGKQVDFTAGDNIHSIIAKINRENLTVRAHFDETNNGLILEATVPHQMWLEDVVGGNVFQSLGVVVGEQQPPYNIATDAMVSGGSVFDAIIEVRDILFKDSQLEAGGKGILALSTAQSNLLNSISQIGNIDARLDIVQSRLSSDSLKYNEMQVKELGKSADDMAANIMELKELETLQDATMQTSARIMQRSLLDFIK